MLIVWHHFVSQQMLVLWHFVSIFGLWDIILSADIDCVTLFCQQMLVMWHHFVSRYQLCDISLVSNSLWFFDTFLPGAWCDEAALYVIGGGYDLGLIKALGPEGTNKIQQYVHQGGSYLGICSGAYFASSYIEFDKDGPLEVCGDRQLKFYPGKIMTTSFFRSRFIFFYIEIEKSINLCMFKSKGIPHLLANHL